MAPYCHLSTLVRLESQESIDLVYIFIRLFEFEYINLNLSYRSLNQYLGRLLNILDAQLNFSSGLYLKQWRVLELENFRLNSWKLYLRIRLLDKYQLALKEVQI